jgi:acetyl-CoA synthetase
VVDDDGRECGPDKVGHIAMWPSGEGYYSLGYWQDDERTREMTRGGWLTIGDLGRRDVDDYFWFEGRADDVIKSAGYGIGPFEVESAILHHPAVAEAAVVGKPDALRGHIVKAYVVLRPVVTAPPGLADEIVETVKQRVGAPSVFTRDRGRRPAPQDRDGQDPALHAAPAMTDPRRIGCRRSS